METNNLAGNSGTTAAGEGNGSVTSAGQDVSREIADLKARLEKEQQEKEIYRAGLLSAKDFSKKSRRITQDVMEDPDKLEEAINAKLQERELEEKARQEAEAKAAENARIIKENEELRRALDAKSAATQTGGSGINEHSESKPQGYWSDAQRQTLREIYASRGMYTSKQIDFMVKKAEEIAQNRTAQSARINDMAPTRQY